MKTTIGGERLGSGNKQEISARNYERSSHDLSYIWRSSMSAGTLVPFLNKVALPGDVFDIELNAEVRTLPTIGPLFGSYKVQLDVFRVPMRLYNAQLHMNKLGIGMDMSNVYLPQLEVWTNNHADYTQTYDDNEQINPSSLLKYLGISGIGHVVGSTNPAKREFNAVSFLSFWDIYKNYYANKQEEVGYYIHSDSSNTIELQPTSVVVGTSGGARNLILNPFTASTGDDVTIYLPTYNNLVNEQAVTINVDGNDEDLSDVFDDVTFNQLDKEIVCTDLKVGFEGSIIQWVPSTNYIEAYADSDTFAIKEFDLSNIDDMRDDILQYAGAGAFVIDENSPEPYNCNYQSQGTNEELRYSCTFSQEGLPLKTYQSDLFNNWISTEWIDGANGINEITAVSTSGDEFTIDALNLATKVYNMLNRIAISGGTYDDWLDAVYTHERVKGVESPVYEGSLIKELAFQEVISQTQTDDQPLGTLAGRGKLTSKNKGGRMHIKIDEPSVIIGIASITPRVEYSQGNDWSVNLKTYDDFHKPELSAIGFQDLIAEQMLWTDSSLNSADGVVTTHSVGKQPAWINYMTEVNKCYGNFAVESKEMFMTLNRRYEKSVLGTIGDATTYIDPTKFNQIFAETNLDAQNFWTQIHVGLNTRRKMSAKVIPNL